MKFNLELPDSHPSASALRKYPGSQFISAYKNASFIYTHNPKLIQKFIDLRTELYDKDPKFIGFRDFQQNDVRDYWGDHNVTQVLLDGERCIGGGMLTFCAKGETRLLPLELDLDNPAYRLKTLLPELALQDIGYVEASRMLVHPDYRNDSEYIGRMFANFYHHARDMQAQYFFAMTDKLRCRMYRKIASLYTGTLATILDHIVLPERPDFEGVKMQIMVWDIQNTHVAALTKKTTEKNTALD
jgi:hypothetical protein